jgi:beta-phosphoglucomutase-like phosphatase (HAD superfamily)
LFGDDPRLANLKPEPDIFLLAAKEAGATAENCIVFEDSPPGILAARRAGTRVVGIAIDEAFCTDAQADIYAADFTDPALQAWLSREFSIASTTFC